MPGKHSIVNSNPTARRRLKIISTALAPAMVVAASLGVATALTADEQLAKEIECDIPGARTDCVAPEAPAETVETNEEPPAATQTAEGQGARSEGTQGEGPDESAAGTGTSQTVGNQTGADASTSAAVSDPDGFADKLSCDLLERFEMTDLECARPAE